MSSIYEKSERKHQCFKKAHYVLVVCLPSTSSSPLVSAMFIHNILYPLEEMLNHHLIYINNLMTILF